MQTVGKQSEKTWLPLDCIANQFLVLPGAVRKYNAEQDHPELVAEAKALKEKKA